MDLKERRREVLTRHFPGWTEENHATKSKGHRNNCAATYNAELRRHYFMALSRTFYVIKYFYLKKEKM
jgi:hypothetical protein